MGKQIWVYPELDSWPLLERDIDKLKSNLSKSAKDEFWSYKDFKSKSYIIHHEKVLRSRDFAIKHGSSKGIVLNLSRPIFNDDKTYAFFQFYPSFIIGGSAYEMSGVILMKYENKKWRKVAVIMDAVYH